MSNSNLMNQVLFNKLDDDLNAAIKEVGGDTSMARGPWDYPEIIKHQLGPKFDFKLGPGIVITEKHGKKYLSATSAAVTTGALNPPTGSYKQPTTEVIEAGTSIQEVFEILFYKILPKMSSVYKGDIIKSSETGTDQYNNEDTRSGLIPNSVYLRLYVANSQEPIYILLSGHGLVNDEADLGAHEYTGSTSEYIKVEVADNIIRATLTEYGVKQLEKISSLETKQSVLEVKLEALQETAVTEREVNTIVEREVKEVFTEEVSKEAVSDIVVELVENTTSPVYQTIQQAVVESVEVEDMNDQEVFDFVDDIFKENNTNEK